VHSWRRANTLRGEAHLEKGCANKDIGCTIKENGRKRKEEQEHKYKKERSQGGALIPRRVSTSRIIFIIKLEICCCCKPLRGGRTSFVKRCTHGGERTNLEERRI
jgi:hypothetical protein